MAMSCQCRRGSRLDLVPPGSIALTSETWLAWVAQPKRHAVSLKEAQVANQ